MSKQLEENNDRAISLLKKLYFVGERNDKNKPIFKEIAKFLTEIGHFPTIISPPEDNRWKQLDIEEEVDKIKNKEI